MKWACMVLLIVGALFCLLCISPVNIHLHYARKADKDHIWIRLGVLFGLLTYTIVVPNLKLVLGINKKPKIEAVETAGLGKRANKRRSLVTVSVEWFARWFRIEGQLIEKLHNFIPHFRKMSKVFQVVQFRWRTEIGSGDAALTGTAAGAVWALKGSVLGLVAYFVSFRSKPEMAVQPRFHSVIFETEVDCIIRFWLGQAMVEAIKMGIYLLREGKKPWQIIRSRG